MEAHGISLIERSDCPGCKHPGEVKYRNLRDNLFGSPGFWTMNKCTNHFCRSLWLSPCPAPEDLHKVYQSYYTHGADGTLPWSVPAFKSNMKSRRLFQWLKKGFLSAFFNYPSLSARQKIIGSLLVFVPPLSARIRFSIREIKFILQGKILDIGCGDGSFLRQLKDLGWSVLGTEVDPLAVQQAKVNGVEVLKGSLLDLNLPSKGFDVVVVNHVLEHVHDPDTFIQECFRILKPGGELKILLPNPESLGHKYFRESWRGLEPPRHLFLPTRDALYSLLERQNFSCHIRSKSQGARFYWTESFKSGSKTQGLYQKVLFYAFWLTEFMLARTFWNSGEELFISARKVTTSESVRAH